MNRRSMLKYSAAALGGVLGYKGMEMAGILPAFGAVKEADMGKLGQAHAELGDYVYLTPQKLGGGAMAVDMGKGKCMAWISYWNYGDTCPIAHHLAAYPSPNPYKHFEFVNTSQGGDNVMIYGLPTPIKRRGLLDRYGQGNNIYRVQFDGQQMNLMENIAETTGIGLGVHTTIYPDARGFACADGQKDVCAFFDRPEGYDKTKVLAAFRADWVPNSKNSLHETWFDGGTLRLIKLTAAQETGKYDYEGTRGNKIDWEMVPMAELLVAEGKIPGDAPRTLTGLDAVVHHPNNRWSALILRMPAAALIMDRKTFEPVCCLHTPKGSPGNLEVKKVSNSPETWEAKFESCKCVAHEAGFAPDGKFFTQMNNLTQNNMAVFDTSERDPREWKKLSRFVEHKDWVGQYPSPFHLCFSMDQSKMFVSVLHPKPANSSVAVVDTKSWKIIHEFKGVGPDCQTMAVTYDGKYVLQIYSGFQRLSCGIFVFRQDNLKPMGFLPNFGGHHDCVIVPTKNEHLLNSRCTTL
jgi:hypothetical protein